MPHIGNTTDHTHLGLEARTSGMAGSRCAQSPVRAGWEGDAASSSQPPFTAVLARLAENDPDHVLDVDELADVIHEGLVQSQRERGASSNTTWLDAAAAAELLLQHVNNVVGAR